jgi:phospholipid-binding lipoprotein MlaA
MISRVLLTASYSMKLIAVFMATVIATQDAHAQDPWEKMNRKSHAFNNVIDEQVLKPVARGYKKMLPDSIETAIGNVYGNLADVNDLVNNTLQGKVKAGFSDLARLTINTTIGVGGLFDPASKMGLVDSNEDFSQTLATWGIPRGPYLVIPLLGPSSVRDMFSRSADGRLDPLRYLHPVDHRNTLYGTRLIHVRAELLAVDNVVFGDRYIFYRDAFLQRREYLEKDGVVEDAFGDEF